ncbi:gastrula zinc finger protein XlCGF17.1-like [Corythoichthys intestinalis]|uniref:gastrula zinc finger protein XlCGF17.1-like n=1 Tax=Corythoichthys intestinalis TaxID=161448 RepID=UPI0025A65C03|nr:gastrula zinc finger protein XlCGF17.1-like [Corythoichthys intestinalis]
MCEKPSEEYTEELLCGKKEMELHQLNMEPRVVLQQLTAILSGTDCPSSDSDAYEYRDDEDDEDYSCDEFKDDDDEDYSCDEFDVDDADDKDDSCLCPQCGKTLKTVSLRGHMKTHAAEKDFVCSVCGVQMATKSHLKRHILTHTGEKPVLCSECGKRFATEVCLKKHMRTHTGEKPQECFVCHRRFGDKQLLRNHMRTHTGEKPYACQLCGKRFAIQSGIIKHQKVHTGEKPFYCAACGRSYTRKVYFTNHSCKGTDGKAKLNGKLCDFGKRVIVEALEKYSADSGKL